MGAEIGSTCSFPRVVAKSRAAEFESFVAAWGGFTGFSGWSTEGINNSKSENVRKELRWGGRLNFILDLFTWSTCELYIWPSKLGEGSKVTPWIFTQGLKQEDWAELSSNWSQMIQRMNHTVVMIPPLTVSGGGGVCGFEQILHLDREQQSFLWRSRQRAGRWIPCGLSDWMYEIWWTQRLSASNMWPVISQTAPVITTAAPLSACLWVIVGLRGWFYSFW